ncbi:hypothetical protein MMC12_004420 [Toensbergia leucococca]|nr:hypothetical protein [Toensbergia leucococca]
MPPTLIKPPPLDPTKSAIENVLELTTLLDIGPDIYSNARPLWHPPGARGIFGGAAIAQSLAAAQLTIESPSPANNNATFLIHSMHCYFVLAGDASIPILYHVERVREGKSFKTRTVQARQRGKCIFTTTLSFMRETSGGKKTIDHEHPIPENAIEALKEILKEEERKEVEDKEAAANGVENEGPFLAKRLGILNKSSPKIYTKKTHQWLKARGHISPAGNTQAHLSALAYMSDSYFIGTVPRVHDLTRLTTASPFSNAKILGSVAEMEANGKDQAIRDEQLRRKEQSDEEEKKKPRISMMVSLDHTIYFHRPREIKADEWLFTEMESPWTGEGRGLVFQKIWSKEGRLVASCVQEVSWMLWCLRIGEQS